MMKAKLRRFPVLHALPRNPCNSCRTPFFGFISVKDPFSLPTQGTDVTSPPYNSLPCKHCLASTHYTQKHRHTNAHTPAPAHTHTHTCAHTHTHTHTHMCTRTH